MRITREDIYEVRSWLTTTISNMSADLFLDIIFGIGTLAQTGSFTIAGAVAIASACLRSTLKYFLAKFMAYLKEWAKKIKERYNA